ncbi:ferrochelatase, partial [Klebsiella pneumoniae]
EPSLWELAEAGVKQIDVVCPGFATDCLETLEEVAMGFTETLAERGAQMRYIPCLNAEPEHARALARLAVASLA